VRRHLHITRVGLIGKEANQVKDTGEENPESEAVEESGRSDWFGPGAGHAAGQAGTAADNGCTRHAALCVDERRFVDV
jgi:hypothetical protein